jgi:amidase
MTDWKSLAAIKRDSILSSIPDKWRLPADKLPSNEDQRDVTKYVQQFLSEKEIEITETDVVGIAEKTTSGTWSAVDVTEAFCHRASLAHQLVSVQHAMLGRY